MTSVLHAFPKESDCAMNPLVTPAPAYAQVTLCAISRTFQVIWPKQEFLPLLGIQLPRLLDVGIFATQ